MKISRRIRNTAIAITIGIGLYLANASTIPILAKSYAFEELPKIQRTLKWRMEDVRKRRLLRPPLIEEKPYYVHDYQGNGQAAALKYVKLANAMAVKYNPFLLRQFPLIERKPFFIKGYCYEITLYTCVNFLSLINDVNKKDLVKYVRIAAGHLVYKNISVGHAWLEVNLDGKWTPYETTLIEIKPYKDINPDSIDTLISDSETINVPDAHYTRTNKFQINTKGEVNSQLDLVGILKDYRGALGKMIFE